MNEMDFVNVIDGLQKYAFEKMFVLGKESKKDVEKIIYIINDMDCFYNNDEEIAPSGFASDIVGVIKRNLFEIFKDEFYL